MHAPAWQPSMKSLVKSDCMNDENGRACVYTLCITSVIDTEISAQEQSLLSQ
jgi:hypothetical protein